MDGVRGRENASAKAGRRWQFSHQIMPNSFDPVDCSPLGSSVRGILQAGILERVAIPSPGDLSNQRMVTASPALAGGFFTAEPPRKP